MSIEQDPFEQVVKDTREQIDRLSHYLSGNGYQRGDEVAEIIQDVAETIEDLNKSLVVMTRNGQDTRAREADVRGLERALQLLKDQRPLPADVEEAPAATANENPFENAMQEQLLREQDTHLDSIHHTMANLHLQAQTMGNELEDQGQLLDEMDSNMDSLGGKLARGRRQLEWIYQKNSERYNDCCIVLLIAALIVLLVLAFVA
ncbi:hypothetical protein HG536_0A06160 [Torulaspora globosa]|uniref:t-SNARE affecting a late Golgi compartment protein 1 n=1 Tax=Torulaspora globosa TaxID=48254 RepID=A0A7G3ZBB5_9SACH|nr:uncharacterized protein HG536_0A06160 [Torulaspora globosa]QLL30801.1 hypothetical protein HG536_0A06160 [Torulaspora globosa]